MKKPNFLALACVLLLVSTGACSPSASSSPTQTTVADSIKTTPENAPKSWSPEISRENAKTADLASLALRTAVMSSDNVNLRALHFAFQRAIESRISFRLIVEESGLDRQLIVSAFEKLANSYPLDEDLADYLAMFRSLRDREKTRLR